VNRALRLIALGCLAAVAGCALLHNQILAGLGGFLDKSDPPQHADVAFVPAGDQTGNRILRAAALAREGYVSQAVISGPYGLYGLNECDLAIPFAVRAGYPQSYFVPFPNLASSTHEEAIAAAQEFRKLGAHRVLLVTSTYHTRRAGNEFRSAAPGIQFIVVSAPDTHFTTHAWWHDREGRKTFLFEWMKTAATWLHM